jgi:hypothetical protein
MYDLPIPTLFWGAVIVVALVAACLLVKIAIESLHGRTKFDDAGRLVNQQRVPATQADTITDQSRRHSQLDPEDDALIDSMLDRRTRRRLTDKASTDIAGFNEREQEEFLLMYGPRTVRKAIRERRNARRQAQKKQSQP